MRRRRILLIVLAVVIAGLVITAAVWLRMHSPPEAARLLPEADAYLYFNLSPLRLAGTFQNIPRVVREPEFEQLVRETGFEFERDLDQAAFAVHSSAQPGRETRFSEVFAARFDLERVRDYLRKHAAGVERYGDRDIFAVRLPGRTLRVVILGAGLVAMSNVDDPQVIRGMLDRYKAIGLPLGGPTLVREYYKRVPWGSLAWAITRVGTAQSGNRGLMLPGGYNLFVPGGTVVVASARYLGDVQLWAEAVTSSEQDAQRLLDQVNAFVAIFRALETGTQVGGPDADVKAFLDSIKVEPKGNDVVLTATAPKGFFQKLVKEGPETSISVGGPQPEQKPAPAPKRKHRRRR